MRAPALLLRSAAVLIAVFVSSSLIGGCAHHRRHSIKDEAAPRTKSKWKATRYKARAARVNMAMRAAAPKPAAIPSVQFTCGTDEACLARLKSLIEDKNRKWVGQAQGPVEHLSGTRQFAYLALRTKLTCMELSRAIGEIGAVPTTISAPGVPPEHIARVRTLDIRVIGELRAERTKRCPNI